MKWTLFYSHTSIFSSQTRWSQHSAIPTPLSLVANFIKSALRYSLTNYFLTYYYFLAANLMQWTLRYSHASISRRNPVSPHYAACADLVTSWGIDHHPVKWVRQGTRTDHLSARAGIVPGMFRLQRHVQVLLRVMTAFRYTCRFTYRQNECLSRIHTLWMTISPLSAVWKVRM